MFELNNNMKNNAAKIFSELIIAKYDESFLLPVLEDMGEDNDYIYHIIDAIDGAPVECYINIVHTIDSKEHEGGFTVDRKIVIIVTADEKAILADLTVADKIVSKNGVFDIEDSFATAHKISIAEALE